LLAGKLLVLAGVKHTIVTAEFNIEAAAVSEKNTELVNNMLAGSLNLPDDTANRLVLSGFRSAAGTINISAANPGGTTAMESALFAVQGCEAVRKLIDEGGGRSVGVIAPFGSSASMSQRDTNQMALKLMDALAECDDEDLKKIIMASVSTINGAGDKDAIRAALDLFDDLQLLSPTAENNLGTYVVTYTSPKVTADTIRVYLLRHQAVEQFRLRQTNCLVEDGNPCHLRWNEDGKCKKCKRTSEVVAQQGAILAKQIVTSDNARDQRVHGVTSGPPAAPKAKGKKATKKARGPKAKKQKVSSEHATEVDEARKACNAEKTEHRAAHKKTMLAHSQGNQTSQLAECKAVAEQAHDSHIRCLAVTGGIRKPFNMLSPTMLNDGYMEQMLDLQVLRQEKEIQYLKALIKVRDLGKELWQADPSGASDGGGGGGGGGETQLRLADGASNGDGGGGSTRGGGKRKIK